MQKSIRALSPSSNCTYLHGQMPRPGLQGNPETFVRLSRTWEHHLRPRLQQSRSRTFKHLRWSRRPRLNGATCHRFGPEAYLTDSYEGGQPPCTISMKGTQRLRIPTARWFYHWLGSRLRTQLGAGDWNRTSDLRFTN
jgi:hypothetical protein